VGSFIFVVMVLGFIWIVRGLAKADQRRQQARQAGFTEAEIQKIDRQNIATETFLSGLIIIPVTFIGMFIISILLVIGFFPWGILPAVCLWRIYLNWLHSNHEGN